MADDYIPLEKLLADRYQTPEWALLFELTKGVGWQSNDGAIDAAAFNCWPSKGHHRLAFEIKRTRGDYLREIRTPAKRAWVEENFHQTYFVCPHGLISKDELPEGWGLLYATKKANKLRQVKLAVHRKVPPLPESIALAALRGAANVLARAQARTLLFEGDEITEEALQRILDDRAQHYITSLRQQIDETESQARALEQEREALQGPFRELEDQRVRYGFRPDPNRPMTLTREDVRQMLQRAERRFRYQVIKNLVGPIAGAHRSLRILLDNAKHYEDELPPSERRVFDQDPFDS